jgi:hypothetical protein
MGASGGKKRPAMAHLVDVLTVTQALRQVLQGKLG